QEASEGDAALLAAAERVDEDVDVGDAQALEERPGLVLALPAAAVLERLGGRALLGEEVGRGRGVGGESLTRPAMSLERLVPGAIPAKNGVQSAYAEIQARHLIEELDPGVAAGDDLPRVGDLDPGEDPRERRLA